MSGIDVTTNAASDTIHPIKRERRKSKIYQLFHSTKSERNPSSKSRRKHHRSSSTTNSSNHSHNKSQFDKLKSIISSIFPKKSVRAEATKKNSKKKARSRSFSFRRKKKHKIDTETSTKYARVTKKKHNRTVSCHINIACVSETEEDYKTLKGNKIQQITPNTMNKLLTDIMEDDTNNESLSETEEYKDTLSEFIATNKPYYLAPRSSSFMRSFEKRPEYITYYPPASLQDAFNTITVDDEQRSVTVETKRGIKQRISAVDELFELAEMTLDYSNFYGYSAEDMHHNANYMDHNDEYALNETSVQLDASILSSYADDNEYDETLSWK